MRRVELRELEARREEARWKRSGPLETTRDRSLRVLLSAAGASLLIAFSSLAEPPPRHQSQERQRVPVKTLPQPGQEIRLELTGYRGHLQT
jgi:hypothetical protein